VTALHLRGTILPAGEPADLWVLGDRITFDRPSGPATTIADGGFLIPGLVDAHAHAGHDEAMRFHPGRFAAAGREYAAAGTTLLRLPGHRSPIPDELRTDPTLPRLITAGRWLAWSGLANLEDLHTPVDSAELARIAVAEAAANDGWCKTYGDWEPFETATPLAVLREVVDAVHAAGYRVAVHCQTAEGTANAVQAGVDSIEHAWYLTDELLSTLAARGGAITPTGTVASGWLPDVRTKPEGPRKSWFIEGYEGLRRSVVEAHEMGVRVLAGTDSTDVAGDVVAEIEWLVECGLSPADALAAASWGAREYLGRPGLVEGAPADIVVYPADPRLAPNVLRHPQYVILKGRSPY